MTRSWLNERSVASVLRDLDYYPKEGNTPDEWQNQFIEEEVVKIGTKQYTLSRITKYDVKLLADLLDHVQRCSQGILYTVWHFKFPP